MGIANKSISTKFLNIIIRTNYGQTEMVMQYGGLRSSVTCVTTSCSNDSFASPTHRTNQSLDKGSWNVIPLVHKCVTQTLKCLPSSSNKCSIGDRSGDTVPELNKYTLSGCKLIDAENISLPNQNINLLASERSERVTSFIFCRAG